MTYFSGWLGDSIPDIQDNENCGYIRYAIVDDNKLIGYFAYQVDWYAPCARSFGLFAFDRNNRTIGLDVYREMKKIINDYHIHRMEWRMVGGNPVEKHYDKFCKKYNGKKLVLTDSFKDRYGKYHNDVIYEIIFEQEG